MWSIYLSFLLGLGIGYGIWKLEWIRLWKDANQGVLVQPSRRELTDRKSKGCK